MRSFYEHGGLRLNPTSVECGPRVDGCLPVRLSKLSKLPQAGEHEPETGRLRGRLGCEGPCDGSLLLETWSGADGAGC